MKENNIGKTASQMRREFAQANRPKKEVVQRMWLLLKTGVDGRAKAESYGWFATEKLGIQPSSLSRKLTDRERHFNAFEVQIFKDFFGEDAMDVDNFDLINGKLIPRINDNDNNEDTEFDI